MIKTLSTNYYVVTSYYSDNYIEDLTLLSPYGDYISSPSLPELTEDRWVDITATDNTFVVLSFHGAIATFDEGSLVVKEAPISSELQFTSISYGDGKYVAVAPYASKVAYSTNLESWNLVDVQSDTPHIGNAITFCGEKFFIYRDGSIDAPYYVFCSDDGANWELSNLEYAYRDIFITYDEKYIACITGDSSIYESEDGITWAPSYTNQYIRTITKEDEDVTRKVADALGLVKLESVVNLMSSGIDDLYEGLDDLNEDLDNLNDGLGDLENVLDGVGKANGIATLDEASNVPLEQIPIDAIRSKYLYIQEDEPEDAPNWSTWVVYTKPKSYTLSNLGSYGWSMSSVPNPDTALYDGVYESTNNGIDNSTSIMRIDVDGYTEFSIYIRSNAESAFDYTIASTVDAEIYPTIYNEEAAYAHTRGNQKSGETIGDYTKVTYTLDGKSHHIYVVFVKDPSQASGTDKGYVLIEKGGAT